MLRGLLLLLVASSYVTSSPSEIFWDIFQCLMDSNTTTPSYQRKITNEEHKFNSENYMNSDQWQCGAGNTEKITKYFNFCWDKLAEMNMCCSIHDDCYGLARGRKKCDQSFFDCLKKSLEFKSSGMLCSGIWTNTAKASICFAGVMFYGESNAKKPIAGYAPALNKTVEKNYLELYEKCPKMNTTFSSCAYNHMICYMRLLPDRNPRNYEDCVDNLIVCLDESSEHLASENEECLTHVEITMKSISENSKISGIPTTREAVGPKHGYKFIYSSKKFRKLGFMHSLQQ
ncbi:hypothetical protein L3Y34_004737 [Caenorhabditis briggsae]|uniref:Uncharacterized protein n=1 Tax=Caenorhabditis briggsae TaxID=6238 RepID=A0AAE9AIF0_CAEBR|nr:hypothetical protein L3Y34_004737 [Caenorhabditis briggsae]